MEAENGAAALTRAPVSPPPAAPSGWIVSPAFDLLFFANLGWLLAVVPGFVAPEGVSHVEFWQVYFLTTPHRWITLVLVTLDPDRREGRTWLFVALPPLAPPAALGGQLLPGA